MRQRLMITLGLLACLAVALTACVEQPGHSEISAWIMTKEFVKARLKAPKTAEFASYSDVVISYLWDGEYRVRGFVDSQNTYGALVRTKFVCRVEHVEGNRWRLLEFTLIN